MSTIFNQSTATAAGAPASSSDGLLIELGTLDANRTTGNTFIGFADSTGTLAGAIVGGASAVSYNTTGADYSEYFSSSSASLPTPGQLVSIDPTSTNGVVASNNTTPIGVVSTSPGFVGNGPLCKISDTTCQSDYNKTHVLVALSGQVPTQVTVANGNIAVGDPITASSTPGVGELAASSTNIIGYALEPATSNGTIQVLLEPSYYNPTQSNINSNNTTLNALTVNNSLSAASINVGGLASITTLEVSGNASIAGNLSVGGSLTVEGVITANAHLVTGNNSGTTTAVAQKAAGTSAICSVSGNDTAGQITLTTGTSAWNSGEQCSVEFSSSYANAPHPVITPANTTSSGAYSSGNVQPYVSANTTTMSINFTNADTAQHTFTWDYFNAQ